MCIELQIKDKIVEMSSKEYFEDNILSIAKLMDKAILEIETVTVIDNIMSEVAASIANWIIYRLALVLPLSFMTPYAIGGMESQIPSEYEPILATRRKDTETSEIETLAILSSMLQTTKSMKIASYKDLAVATKYTWYILNLKYRGGWFYQYTNTTKKLTHRKELVRPLVDGITNNIRR